MENSLLFGKLSNVVLKNFPKQKYWKLISRIYGKYKIQLLIVSRKLQKYFISATF